MTIQPRLILASVAALGLWGSSSRAQSLGGYGAMTGSGMTAGSATGGGTVAPFGGRFGAGMASSMGGGSSVAFRPRSSAMMTSQRTPFTIAPRSGMAGGMGWGRSRRSFSLPSLDPILPSNRMPGTMSTPGVMPPRFTSPFRPPSVFEASTVGGAMPM